MTTNFEIGKNITELLEGALLTLVLIVVAICRAYKHKKSCEAAIANPSAEYIPGSENDND